MAQCLTTLPTGFGYVYKSENVARDTDFKGVGDHNIDS